ncbi:MAG: hypothetical protein JSU85_00055 [Candidatus Zixiibacteriota bacterium]|nr:MAG: hypothetical protein JSU85_00055 [candidate division Zixibacteria bacterium]
MRYSPLDKINFFITTYGKLFASILKIPNWLPFLILALFQAAGLLAFSKFYMGGLNQVLFPVLSKIFPPAIFHYPQYYLALPAIYSGYSAFILGPTVWVIMSAVAVYKLGGYKKGIKHTFGGGLDRAFKSYLPLFLFWIIETVIVFAVLWILTIALKDYVAGSPRVKFMFEYGFQLFAYIFSAFLLFTIPGIVISGKKLGGALKGSIRLCGSNFFLTYFIIAIPASAGAMIDLFVSGFSSQIITLFNPELVAVLLYIRIGLGIFINLFIYGAAVFVYDEMSESR